MNFEWDAGKAQTNLEKHKVRFEVAIKVFLDPGRTQVVDDRYDYGEERVVTYGRIDGRLYVVVFTRDETSQTIRMISARKANQRERRRHGDS